MKTQRLIRVLALVAGVHNNQSELINWFRYVPASKLVVTYEKTSNDGGYIHELFDVYPFSRDIGTAAGRYYSAIKSRSRVT